jgi:hypothetical protein
MSKIGDMKARLKVVTTLAEQPCPGKPLDEDEIADMLMFLVGEVERLGKKVKELEALKGKP